MMEHDLLCMVTRYGENEMTDESRLEQQTWRNLAPNILRQRLMIEGTTLEIVEPPQILDYLKQLAVISGMEVISGPYTRSAHELGFGGWVHWRTSGCHFYSYSRNMSGGVNDPLFTVDTYTCKPFSVEEVVEFTRQFLRPLDLVWREIVV